nr:hypothetical protein [Deltaproteobacteria bacterium]
MIDVRARALRRTTPRSGRGAAPLRPDLATLAKALSAWFQDASGRIAEARGGAPEDQAVIAREWDEHERRARDALRRFTDSVERQPTAATMGKVNASKTLMLSRWYGDLEELRGAARGRRRHKRLPHPPHPQGRRAARQRHPGEDPDNASFEREPRAAEEAAALDEFPSSLHVTFEPGNRDEFANALRVCRFPTADDANYELEEVRGRLPRHPPPHRRAAPPRARQLRASEVTLRVRPLPDTRASRIFEVPDLVDCPGRRPADRRRTPRATSGRQEPPGLPPGGQRPRPAHPRWPRRSPAPSARERSSSEARGATGSSAARGQMRGRVVLALPTPERPCASAPSA